MNSDRVFVGIDFGTSGCRAIAIDQAHTPVARAEHPLPSPRRPQAGTSEQDPEIWWQALRQLLARLHGELRGRRIGVIAVDGTSATLVMCDRAGRPQAPALMYDDSRSLAQLSTLRAVAPADNPVLSATSSLAKALYLRAQHSVSSPGLMLHQADWIAGRLSGHFGISDENNCLKLGYDALTRRWPDWVFTLGLERTWFPRVQPAGADIGCIDPQVAADLKLDPEARIHAGTTDSTAAAIAAGIHRSGDAVTVLGSTLVVKILADSPVFAAEFGVYSHRLGDRWLVGGASNSGGAVLAHYFGRDRMSRLSREVRPDQPTNLAYYPLLRPGERFPFADPTHLPRVTPRPAEDARFFQGLLEGIASIEQRGYQRLQRLGTAYPQRVSTIGGGAHNLAWQQIRQRILGIPVTAAGQQHAAYGAALLAAGVL